MKALHLVFLAVLAIILQGCYSEPIANFDYDYENNSAPAEVSFSNMSTDAEDFRWDFGDGNSSNAEHPVHVFETPGSYTISLLAKGRGGESSISKDITITQSTSYIIKNQTSYNLYNVLSFYWDGENIIDDVDHGTIVSGSESGEVFPYYTIIDIAFEFSDGSLYLLTYPFELTANLRNNLIITDQTNVTEVSSTQAKSIKSLSDLRQLQESGQKVMVQDLEK